MPSSMSWVLRLRRSSRRLKPESRVLELLVKGGIAIGLVTKGNLIEHFLIERVDSDLPERLSERGFIKEVRKVVIKGGNSELLSRLLGAEALENLPHEELMLNILDELEKLSGR